MNCQKCGATTDLIDIRGYDWDSDDDNALSIQRVIGHRCLMANECAERVIEQGGNAEALHEIASDRENYGGQAARAREVLRQMGRLMGQLAQANDAAAREGGAGTIGGGW